MNSPAPLPVLKRDLETEAAAVIFATLLSGKKKALKQISGLQPTDFSNRKHQIVFSAILETANGDPADALKVALAIGDKIENPIIILSEMVGGAIPVSDISRHVRVVVDAAEFRRTNRQKPTENGPGEVLILDYRKPLDAAKEFSKVGRKKMYWQGCIYEYTGSSYQEKTQDDIKSAVYGFLDGAHALDKKGRLSPYLPNRNRVGEIMDALKATVNLPDSLKPPCFIRGDDDPQKYLSVQNGLLNIRTRKLIESTPDFFTLNSLPYAYDPRAAAPVEWNRFLETLWPDDKQAINALQEIFGYLLTSDTSQQKIFCVVGPMRSGKGTISRILTALLGADNVSAPTLGSLAREFGLAGLIGKKAAIISDARLSAKADQSAIAERLLSISGEDHQGVPRKFMSDFNGPLQVRFVIFSNELPRLSDASGALPSRFVLLTMKKSFLGKEDHGLTNRLLGELPSILNWSLDGLNRLNERGYFLQPNSSLEALQELSDLSSPIGAFLRDSCTQGPEYAVEVKTLYIAWCRWCEDQGRDYPGNQQSFGRDLRAAVPGLSSTHPRVNGERQRMYQGINLI